MPWTVSSSRDSVFCVLSPVKIRRNFALSTHHVTAPLPTLDHQHHLADHVYEWGQLAAQWDGDSESHVCCSRIRQRWHEIGSTQHLLQCHSTGRWLFIAHDLFVLPSPRPQLVVSHQFDKNCIAWGATLLAALSRAVDKSIIPGKG